MKKNDQDTKIENSSANYELKSEAVNELVEAMEQEAPEYSKEELEKYRSKRGIKIPDPVKFLAIKAWFAGAVCFFILWGLGLYLANMLDMLFVASVAMGMVTDLLVNPILRFMEKYPGQNDKWMLFPKKTKLGSFFLNIIYSFFLVYCVYSLYTTVNVAINTITGNPDAVTLGVEPILFGLLCMGFDMLFISIKRLFLNILQDAKTKARNESST